MYLHIEETLLSLHAIVINSCSFGGAYQKIRADMHHMVVYMKNSFEMYGKSDFKQRMFNIGVLVSLLTRADIL